MEPAAAVAAREPGGRYGDLPPLARQALEPRVSRIETEMRLSELQAAGTRAAETGENTAQPAPDHGRAAPSAPAQTPDAVPHERRGDPPALQENPAYSLASFRADAPAGLTLLEAPEPHMAALSIDPPAQPQLPLPGAALPQPRLTDPDGYRRALLGVQSELRTLRADIAALARALGQRTSPALVPTAPGVLQLADPLRPETQAAQFQHTEEQLGQTPRQLATDTSQQLNERRLTLKQEQLLRALRQAENRLQNLPPGTVPPGLKEQVIGEILRARYSAALFGGLGGAALTGRLASAVA